MRLYNKVYIIYIMRQKRVRESSLTLSFLGGFFMAYRRRSRRRGRGRRRRRLNVFARRVGTRL